MSLTSADVAEIVRLLDASSFGELRLETGDLKLVIRRGAGGAWEEPAPAAAPAPVAAAPAAPKPAAAATAPKPVDASLAEITAPLLGTFYRAPKPGDPPFVEVGSRVEADTIIAIIEVMKLMNPVRAGIAGEVAEILIENAGFVEYGQPLMRVRKG
jgi:acetyl-CoA carboxylase biotin carboxyl carrier protein